MTTDEEGSVSDQPPLDLHRSQLPPPWRSNWLRAYVLIMVVGGTISVFIGPTAIRSFQAGLQFVLGLAWALIVTSLVWPPYRRLLPSQVRSEEKGNRATYCWATILFAGIALSWCIDHGMGPGVTHVMSGYVLGTTTFFYRIARWLDALPP